MMRAALMENPNDQHSSAFAWWSFACGAATASTEINSTKTKNQLNSQSVTAKKGTLCQKSKPSAELKIAKSSRKRVAHRSKETPRKRKKILKAARRMNLQRRKLPWVKIEKEYVFDGPMAKWRSPIYSATKANSSSITSCSGRAGSEGCPHCSFWADHLTA